MHAWHENDDSPLVSLPPTFCSSPVYPLDAAFLHPPWQQRVRLTPSSVARNCDEEHSEGQRRVAVRVRRKRDGDNSGARNIDSVGQILKVQDKIASVLGRRGAHTLMFFISPTTSFSVVWSALVPIKLRTSDSCHKIHRQSKYKQNTNENERAGHHLKREANIWHDSLTHHTHPSPFLLPCAVCHRRTTPPRCVDSTTFGVP